MKTGNIISFTFCQPLQQKRTLLQMLQPVKHALDNTIKHVDAGKKSENKLKIKEKKENHHFWLVVMPKQLSQCNNRRPPQTDKYNVYFVFLFLTGQAGRQIGRQAWEEADGTPVCVPGSHHYRFLFLASNWVAKPMKSETKGIGQVVSVRQILKANSN